MQHIRLLLITSLWILVPFLAYAAQAVSLTMEAQKEVESINEKGEKEIRYVEAESVVPGDVLRYSIRYHNAGAQAADALVITNPIPQHMEYLAGSAHGQDTRIIFSIDGGKSFDQPENLTVIETDGSKRTATAGEYTHIQWRMNNPLPPAGEGSVGYRAKLE